MEWCDEHDAGILDALEAGRCRRTAGEAEPFPGPSVWPSAMRPAALMIAAHADAADTTCWRPSTPTSCATSQRFRRR